MEQRGRYQQPETRDDLQCHSLSLSNILGLAYHCCCQSSSRLRLQFSRCYCHSCFACFFCYLTAERCSARGWHTTASIEGGPKDHLVRAGEAAHHHVASSRRGRAARKEAWWRLHVSRWSGDVVGWENTRRHVWGLEHAGDRSVSRLTHQARRGDHGSLHRRHLLTLLHELLLLLLLLQSVVQARWPLQYLGWMHGSAVAFRVSELLVSEARWPLRAHLPLRRATLLHEFWLTLWEMRKRGLSLGLRHAHDLFDAWLLRRRMAAALHELHEKVPAGV